MTKLEFISAVSSRLKGLPEADIDKSLEFYNEMIDDRMEDGIDEEEAVAAVGSPEDVANAILAETPLLKIVKAKSKPKEKGAKSSVWKNILIWVGSPIWLPLGIAVFCILLSIFIVIWAIPFAFWVAEITIGASALGMFAGAILQFGLGNTLTALLYLGASLLLAGLAVAGWLLTIIITKYMGKFSKFTFRGLKILFMGGKR